MVLNNNPKAVLELLATNQEKHYADGEDDDFLDRLEKKVGDVVSFPPLEPGAPPSHTSLSSSVSHCFHGLTHPTPFLLFTDGFPQPTK